MNRTDFQALATIRLGEALVLLAASRFDGAYYLAGYAVECALKACIAKQTNVADFPPSPRQVQEMYSHDLVRLLRIADLSQAMEVEVVRNPLLAVFWDTAKDWSEQSRYQQSTEEQARALCEAIADQRHGVMQWLQQHW